MDISEDELATLGDEDSAATAPGTRKDTSLTELQSFVDLVYTPGRSVTALQWLPHRKVHKSTHWVTGLLVFNMLFCILFFSNFAVFPEGGCFVQGAIAMACKDHQGEGIGAHYGILIWTFADLINPECILDAPVEVGTFQINLGMPHMVVGGCSTGQVILWDTSAHDVRLRPRTCTV